MPISIKLPPWLLDWMASRPESRPALIERAMREFYCIAPKKKEEKNP